MTRSPSDEGMRWLRQARADLLSVQTLLAGDRFDTACYQRTDAQWAIEAAQRAAELVERLWCAQNTDNT